MANQTEITIQLERIKQLEQQVEALESRNAFQDDVIEQLNQEVTLHQNQLAELSYQIKFIANRMKEIRLDAGVKPEDEPPPPHY